MVVNRARGTWPGQSWQPARSPACQGEGKAADEIGSSKDEAEEFRGTVQLLGLLTLSFMVQKYVNTVYTGGRKIIFKGKHVFGLDRSEEHTSELQSPFLISYAVFCLDRKSTL